MSRSAGMLALLVLAVGVSPAAAQRDKTTQFAVKGILLAGGQAYVQEADAYFDINTSIGVGGSVDTRLAEKLYGGAFVDLLNVSALDETALMFEGGLAIKAALGGENGRPSFRPNIGLGWGVLSGVGGLESSHYLTIRAGLEAVMSSGWVAEAMAWGAPSGGNSDLTITYGPMLQLRVGHLF